MPTLREYLDDRGRSPFARWLDSVGGGVHEVRIDFGPGYRVYLGLDGAELVILLGGSAKARQSVAIADARERWTDYRRRQRLGEQETD
jgi:putative addiction module killer protein